MKTRLRVIKADGTSEEYLHTKVMHTISKALACVEQTDIVMAENLSEVVTYYLYKRHGETAIQSSEILSVVKVTLTVSGYEAAAEALTNHHYQRKLRRGRIELVHVNLEDGSDANKLFGEDYQLEKSPWDKSVIVEDLVAGHGLDRQCARMIAGMVEEKVFNLELTQVPVSLVKQLLLSDTAAVLRAQRQLQPA
jgi:hypothetical protein